MASKCKEKYGKEWSHELTATTRKFLQENGTGVLKHIDGKPYCLFLDLSLFTKDPEALFHLVSSYFEDVHDVKRYILTSTEEKVEFTASYDSIDEIINDGWAVD